MKLLLLTPAIAAILGLALASAPVTVQAQTTDTTTAVPATTTAAPAPTAKPAKTKSKKPEYQGILTAVDTTANTITVATSKKDPTKTLTLNIASTAIITKNKQPATLADFIVGEKVSGSYTTDASGTKTALKLTFNTPKAKTHKKPVTPVDTTAAPATPAAPAESTPAPAPAPAPAMPASQ